VNLTNKGITGKEADAALDTAGIIVNKNAVPYDEKPPAVASGIRLGTPIVSTRGMKEAEMKEIVDLVDRVLQHRHDTAVLEQIRGQAKALCSRFPIFQSY
jgi:glycine hydroxymethyltransferase